MYATEAETWLLKSDQSVNQFVNSLPKQLSASNRITVSQPESIFMQANDSYWLVINISKLDNLKSHIIYLDQPNLKRTQFYLLDANFAQLQVNTHNQYSMLHKITPHWLIEPQEQSTWAIVNFQHEHSVTAKLALIDAATFELNLHKKMLLYGAIFGVLLLSMVISCVFFCISKRIKFLFLFSYFVFLFATFLVDKGLSSYVGLTLDWSSKFVTLEFALYFATLFLLHFINVKNINRQLTQFWQSASIAFLIVAALTAFFPQINKPILFKLCCIIFIILSLTTMLLLKKKKKRTAFVSKELMLGAFICQVASWAIWNGFGVRYAIEHDLTLLLVTLFICSVVLMRDRQRISKFSYSLTHDQDTHLPNKQLLLSEMHALVNRQQTYSLMLFKPQVLVSARATFGYEHANGCINSSLAILTEQLKVMNALELERHGNKSSWIARVDDSIFALVIVGHLELSRIEQFACVVHGVFDEGITHNSTQLVDHLDIGIAHYPIHGKSAKTILQRSIQALSVKPMQGERWRIFDLENARLSKQRLMIASSLKEAITDDQLNLYFQPQIDLTTGQVIGAEALLRWHHPTLGHISPDVFIPIAESSGVIYELTEWVVAEAIKCQATFLKIRPKHVMSINISARDLLSKELPVLFITLLSEYDLPADSFMLELTESATLDEGMNIKTALDDYRFIGVKIAIDDFGTGYSSLTYLSQLGFDEIKIDKQFVVNLEYSINDQSICRATCDIAKSLGSKVVAEGIEDKQSLMKLKDYGCEIGQGYYFAKPMSEHDYEVWLQYMGNNSFNLDGVEHQVEKSNY
ncbi:EAL domain-containing protein [Pseudoalteromonas mariniglutinosa]|uniref:EAL domain-containing protein n=1 Tax=Pseudoalteromonas mariniglutinosa TaxID=206042 RepID=UPI0038517343